MSSSPAVVAGACRPALRRRALRAAALLTAGALALGAASCGSDDATALRSAGDWQTWAIAKPDSLRVPAPSAGRKAGEARSAQGVAIVGPWMEAALRFISLRTKDPPASSRAYGYVSVAMSDAAVSAAHWQQVYDDPTYPSTEAAIAAAASDVMQEIFPEAPAARYRKRAEAVAARYGDREAADRGLALGHDVARAVIKKTRTDGSQRTWDGKRPRGRGSWEPPPGSLARPVAPLAGTWATWVLTSGDQFRAPPPPKYGSEEFLAQTREVLATERKLTDREKEIARYWAGGEGTPLPAGIWNQITLGYLRQAGWDTTRVARALALVNVAMSDAGVAAWDTKFAYWTARPENAIRDLGLDRDWTPYLETPFFPSYVSGHATYSGAIAEVLAYLFPADAERIHAKADEAAISRLYGGIHYTFDNDIGLDVGAKVGKLVVQRAEKDQT